MSLDKLNAIASALSQWVHEKKQKAQDEAHEELDEEVSSKADKAEKSINKAMKMEKK